MGRSKPKWKTAFKKNFPDQCQFPDILFYDWAKQTSRIKDEWSHNFLRTEKLVMFDRAVMAYKIMNRLCPENLWNNSNKDPSTPATTRDSAEIFRFRGIIWSMPKKDFPIQLLRTGMKSQ